MTASKTSACADRGLDIAHDVVDSSHVPHEEFDQSIESVSQVVSQIDMLNVASSWRGWDEFCNG